MSNIYQFVYGQPLYRIIMIMIFGIFIWGYFGYKANGKLWWQLANGALCVLMIVCILGTTIFTRSVGTRELVLIPFHSFVVAKSQTELYRSMLMNVFLFFFYGLVLPFAFPKRFPHKLIMTIITGFAFSAAIEILQFLLCLGRCEVDDVLMNTFGMLIGVGGYIWAHYLQHFRIKKRFDTYPR